MWTWLESPLRRWKDYSTSRLLQLNTQSLRNPHRGAMLWCTRAAPRIWWDFGCATPLFILSSMHHGLGGTVLHYSCQLNMTFCRVMGCVLVTIWQHSTDPYTSCLQFRCCYTTYHVTAMHASRHIGCCLEADNLNSQWYQAQRCDINSSFSCRDITRCRWQIHIIEKKKFCKRIRWLWIFKIAPSPIHYSPLCRCRLASYKLSMSARKL